MRRTRVLGPGLALLAVLVGCSDEIPTSVGAGIVDPGFRTYEVVLDADAFLERDTTYDRLGSVHSVPFAMVANEYEGDLSAHTLFRVNLPRIVSWQDTAGTAMSDSIYNVVGATITLLVDTVSENTDPVTLEVVQLTESWDPASFTWELRSDTAGTPVEWQVPGGTPGAPLGEASWAGGDTLIIPLDSAAASVWTDSAAAFNGGLIRAATPGGRMRIQSVGFRFEVRPAGQDTIVGTGSALAAGFVVTDDETVPAAGELRVGGVPTWRSAIRFRSLADVRIPCAAEDECTTVALSDVTVSLASLLLRPLPVGSRRIERPYRVEGRAILGAPGVPINRSALTPAFGTMEDEIEPEVFDGVHADAEFHVPLTTYVNQNIRPTEGSERILWVALLTTNELGAPVFGYGAFGGQRSATPPRLRLVVTAPIGGTSP